MSADASPQGREVGPLPSREPPDEVDEALLALFQAYDLDESGILTREEFLKIEMRLCYGAGKVFHEDSQTAKLTLADRERRGVLSFDDFRERQLQCYHELALTRSEIIARINQHRERALAERVRMGPRYHAEVRQTLKQMFTLLDISGTGALTPEEWITAQKVVAAEMGDEVGRAWIGEATFIAADKNGDRVLDEGEFLEATFSVLEGAKQRIGAVLASLERITASLARELREHREETVPLQIMVQTRERPEFRAPSLAWQDEPTEEDTERNACEWKEA